MFFRLFYEGTYLIAPNFVLLIIIYRLVPVSCFYRIYYFCIYPFGCCLRLTRCFFKGKCLSIMSKNKDDQLSTISFVSSNILITSQGVEDKSLINSASLIFLKDLYEIE